MRFSNLVCLVMLCFAGCATTGSQQEVSAKFSVGDCVAPSAATLAQIEAMFGPKAVEQFKNLETKVEAIGPDYYVIRTSSKSDPSRNKVDLLPKADLDTQGEKTDCAN